MPDISVRDLYTAPLGEAPPTPWDLKHYHLGPIALVAASYRFAQEQNTNLPDDLRAPLTHDEVIQWALGDSDVFFKRSVDGQWAVEFELDRMSLIRGQYNPVPFDRRYGEDTSWRLAFEIGKKALDNTAYGYVMQAERYDFGSIVVNAIQAKYEPERVTGQQVAVSRMQTTSLPPLLLPAGETVKTDRLPDREKS